jgi:hypothetical protein
MRCPICNTKFHACSSCCLSNEWEYTYCSYICYLKSDQFKEDIIGDVEEVFETIDSAVKLLEERMANGHTDMKDVHTWLLDKRELIKQTIRGVTGKPCGE